MPLGGGLVRGVPISLPVYVGAGNACGTRVGLDQDETRWTFLLRLPRGNFATALFSTLTLKLTTHSPPLTQTTQYVSLLELACRMGRAA